MALLHTLLDSEYKVEFPKVRLRNMIQGTHPWYFHQSVKSYCAGQDADGSGTLDYDEFVALVDHMKTVCSLFLELWNNLMSGDKGHVQKTEHQQLD